MENIQVQKIETWLNNFEHGQCHQAPNQNPKSMTVPLPPLKGHTPLLPKFKKVLKRPNRHLLNQNLTFSAFYEVAHAEEAKSSFYQQNKFKKNPCMWFLHTKPWLGSAGALQKSLCWTLPPPSLQFTLIVFHTFLGDGLVWNERTIHGDGW